MAADKQNFVLMNDFQMDIDVTPDAPEPTWAPLRAGISSLESAGNEETDQTQYMDGNGYGTTTVTGKQETYSVSGHRKIGDEAQDFIYSYEVKHGIGNARETQARVTDPGGDVITGPITIAAVEGPSGDAGTKGEISFEIHFNGKPVLEPATPEEPVAG